VVTNAQYERFRPEQERNRNAQGDEDPVTGVQWEEAKEYCAWLSGESGRPIRLPSESEWECACRAGSNREFTYGDDEEQLSKYAWFGWRLGWRGDRAHAVASKLPNRWGLYDLHGNVMEWCEDTYHASYEGAPSDGSPWTEGGEEWEPGSRFRVFRGGSWYVMIAEGCRSACRFRQDLPPRFWLQGFRPAFSNPDD